MTDIAALLTRFTQFTNRAGFQIMMMESQRRVKKDQIRAIVEEMDGLRAELNELLDAHDRT